MQESVKKMQGWIAQIEDAKKRERDESVLNGAREFDKKIVENTERSMEYSKCLKRAIGECDLGVVRNVAKMFVEDLEKSMPVIRKELEKLA